MTMQVAISYFFYGVASISLFCFLLLAATYWKRERNEKKRLRQMRSDINDINGIFQSMRKMVEQQEAMAVAFDENLDKKMSVVKAVLGQGLNRNEELYERQRALSAKLDAAEARLEDIQGQLAGLDMGKAIAASAQAAEQPDEISPGHDEPSEEARLLELRGADDNGEARDGRENLSGARGRPAPGKRFDAAPRAPADPNGARQAFRSLLDVDARPQPPEQKQI